MILQLEGSGQSGHRGRSGHEPCAKREHQKLIQQKVSESGYDDFRYVAEDGKQYVNMAMLFAGLIDPSTSKVWIDGEEANDENLYDSQRLIVKEESIFGLNPFGFYGYDCTETEITPFTVLKIDGEYLRQLREGRAGSGENNSADAERSFMKKFL